MCFVSEKSVSILKFGRLNPLFFSKTHRIVVLIYLVIINFELIFMYAVKETNMLGTIPVLIGLGG